MTICGPSSRGRPDQFRHLILQHLPFYGIDLPNHPTLLGGICLYFFRHSPGVPSISGFLGCALFGVTFCDRVRCFALYFAARLLWGDESTGPDFSGSVFHGINYSFIFCSPDLGWLRFNWCRPGIYITFTGLKIRPEYLSMFVSRPTTHILPPKFTSVHWMCFYTRGFVDSDQI